MPRKSRPRKSVERNLLAETVWVAPRPVNTSKHRAFEPVGTAQSNRYLEFADIAFGAKKSSLHNKKKPHNDSGHAEIRPAQNYDNAEGKVTPINSRNAKLRGPNQGFGAFRNTR
ncbi:MAG TPA: hypothetical protein VHV32_01685 [Candidatus Angelobacter sp.]|nr:hypothetical protein [Candidatus Angelobacter sp.]